MRPSSHNRGMSSDLRLCLGAACPFASTRKQWTTMDPSRFSEGDRESHRMGSVRLFLIFVCPPKKRRERTLQMSGTDTTSSNARRPQEETRDQSMS
ncbi:hypothetical protein EJB05_49147, partial [Eragrostis curvula]